MFRLPTGLIYTHDEGGWGQEDLFQLAADSMNGANSMNVGGSEIKTIQSVGTEPLPETEVHTSACAASKQPDVTSTSPEGSQTPVDETTETGRGGQTKNTSLAPNKSKSQEAPKTSEYQIMRDQFDQEKKQLNQQITQLQAEKKQLSDADLKTMPDKELNEQEEKENDLNARIDQLKSDQSQFLERVRQFNERIKNNQTE